MADPLIEATRVVLEKSLREIRKGVADLTGDQLNARPAGGEANSVAVICAQHMTRELLRPEFQ